MKRSIISQYTKIPLWCIVCCALAISAYFLAPSLHAQSQSAADSQDALKKEKARTEKEISATQSKITENERRTRHAFEQLNQLDDQINRQDSTIINLQNQLEELEIRTIVLNDSLERLKWEDSVLCVRIAEGFRLRHIQKHRINPLAFITSARSIKQIRQRLNYINRIQSARSSRIADMRLHRVLIRDIQDQIATLETEHKLAINQLGSSKSVLYSRLDASKKNALKLLYEGDELNRQLLNKNNAIRRHDAEINRIIGREQRREADRQYAADNNASATTRVSPAFGSVSAPSLATNGYAKAASTSPEPLPLEIDISKAFLQSKGSMPFPVTGSYNLMAASPKSPAADAGGFRFDDSAIVIAASKGAKARSVFDGTVASVFFIDGYENIVMIRHGDYVTVYSGIGNVNVRKGEKVQSGQTIGSVASDNGKAILHFEILKDRTKLDPLQWVAG